MSAPGDLRSGHCHNRTGDMAVTPARDVAASRITRDAFLPSNQTGHNFCLKIGDRAALRLSEEFDIGMSKLDVLLQLFGHQITSCLDFCLG